MEKINKLENENRMLTNSNKSAKIAMKIMKFFLKTVQVDENSCKKDYKKLQLKHKELLAKIQSTRKVCDNNDVAKFNGITKKRKNINKGKNYISSNSYFTNEGLL